MRSADTPPVLIQAPSRPHCMARSGRLRPPFFLARRFLCGASFFHAKEEIIKKKIGVLVLGAALAFGMSTGAWAQGGGAGGGAGGAGGGAGGMGCGGKFSV